MKNKRTLVEIVIGRVNEAGMPINEQGTPIDEFKETTSVKDFVQAVDKRTYYLLHWGMHSEIRRITDAPPVVISFTVGICQDTETGHVEIFAPEQIKVLGKEV